MKLPKTIRVATHGIFSVQNFGLTKLTDCRENIDIESVELDPINDVHIFLIRIELKED